MPQTSTKKLTTTICLTGRIIHMEIRFMINGCQESNNPMENNEKLIVKNKFQCRILQIK